MISGLLISFVFSCVFFPSSSSASRFLSRPISDATFLFRMDFFLFLLFQCRCCACVYVLLLSSRQTIAVHSSSHSFCLAFVLSKPFLICLFHLCHQHSIGRCITSNIRTIHCHFSMNVECNWANFILKNRFRALSFRKILPEPNIEWGAFLLSVQLKQNKMR